MLLVIFGAGASYDSVSHFPPTLPSSPREPYEEFRPPLANQLFDNRPMFVQFMQNYAACKPLVNRLRGDVQVERQLAKFEEEAKTFPTRNGQLTAIRYYLHEMLWECQNRWHHQHKGITNYLTFVDAIDRWRFENRQEVCFVTFNYDTMLERSLTELWGVKFTGLDSYTSHPNFKLIKLHGSIDWGLEFNTAGLRHATASVAIDAAVQGFDVSGSFQKIVRPPVLFADQTHGLPALAIPIEKKSEFVCPPAHITALAGVLPKVTKIITIGWRATEQHFLKMLKNRLTGLHNSVDLMVVTGSREGVKQTTDNLSLINEPSMQKYFGVDGGFSGLINNITELEAFLSVSPKAPTTA